MTVAQEEANQEGVRGKSGSNVSLQLEVQRQWATRFIIAGPYVLGLISLVVSVTAIAIASSHQTGHWEGSIRDVIETLQQEFEIIKRALNATQHDASVLGSKLQRLDADFKAVLRSQAAWDDISQNLTNVQREQAEASQQVQAIVAGVEEIRGKTDGTSKELTQLKLDLSELDEKHDNDYNNLDSKMQTQRSDLTAKIEANGLKVDDLRVETSRNVTIIWSELAKTNREVQEMAASIEEVRESPGELSEEISQVKRDLSELGRKHDRDYTAADLKVEKLKSNLSEKIQANSDKADDLRSEMSDNLSATNQKINQLTQQAEETRSDVQKLQDDDDQITEDLLIVKRNIATLQQSSTVKRTGNAGYGQPSSMSLIIIAILCWLLYQE